MTNPDDDEMSHIEFVRAQFFCSESEMEEIRATREVAQSSEFAALDAFVRALETWPEHVRQANLRWLVDRYLR
jgi:hypothetical protein